MRRLPGAAALCLLLTAAGRPVDGALLINEFLPDPDGSDAGREFVELLNTGAQRVCLDGVALQFGNGTESAQWVTRWTGTASDTLGPGGRFLIVDRNWTGDVPGQAEVWLGLQNGPDALQLTDGTTVLDRVGYGPLTDPLMFEGQAVAVAAGRSLARRPDGWDTDHNANDFTAADPTPGRPNFLPYDLDLVDLVLKPPSADRVDVPVRLGVRLVNRGTETLPAGLIRLELDGVPGPSATVGAWPPDETRSLSLLFTVRHRGRLALRLAHGDAGRPEGVAVDLGGYQAGPGPVVLNEVQGAPARGEGEWCEIAVTADTAVALGGFGLRDEGGQWVALPDTLLAPGDLLVVCQSPEDFERWRADLRDSGYAGACPADPLPGGAFPVRGAWPGLNNTAPAGRDFADRLHLGDPTGMVIDHVTLAGTEAGLSLERSATAPAPGTGPNWRPTTSPAAGTPGCPNSVGEITDVGGTLQVRPSVLDPASGSGNVHVTFKVPSEALGCRVRICDLWGHTVRDLGGEARGPGPRDLIWDGRDDRGRLRPDGPCVVCLDLVDGDGIRLSRERALVVVRGTGR